jgi:hypothetical protein
MVRDAWRCHAPHHEGPASRACAILILRSALQRASRRMAEKIADTPPRSRGKKSARVMHHSCPSISQRAQGAPDAPVAPAARMQKKNATGTPKHRHSLRNGFTAYTRSPRSAGLVSLRPPGLMTRGLIPASGDRDRAISPYAPATLVARSQRVHRIPLPTSVTIASRPS